MNDQSLMTCFDFDQAELEINRQRRLSQKQKARLEKQEHRAKGCNVFLGIILFGVALIGIILAIVGGIGFSQIGLVPAIVWGIVWGGIWPLIWGGLGLMMVKRAFAKMSVQVKHVQGPINIVKAIREHYDSDSNTTSEYAVYELRVGGRTFEVESETADLMMQGDVYAVHYADINIEESEDPILSVELIEHTK
ncbi:MAG: hypothetical protein HZC40_24655 [Chloroflexi bacterium]|nr:hypothetical protein [Chloroflexota bacterium]